MSNTPLVTDSVFLQIDDALNDLPSSEKLGHLLRTVNPELPVVSETPDDEKPWGVSLGGFNPNAHLYFECPDEDSAWRLHDAITLLIMKTDPNLSRHAISETISRDLMDQMIHRLGIWTQSGLPQETLYVGEKGLSNPRGDSD